MKKLCAFLLACLLLCGLAFGCGKGSEGALMGSTGKFDGAVNDEAGSSNVLTDSMSQTSTATPSASQKLVRKIWLEAETESMDPLLEDITKRLAELEGYVESRNVHNGSQYSSHRYRSAELTLRIPADKLDQFVSQVSEKANIVSNRETADDVTLTYVAVESRIAALNTEQTRLMELLAEAQNMGDLLQIEERLTKVQAELEEAESQLRVLANKVDYGTVYLTVNEVKEYTVVEEEPETVWERISTGFVRSLKDLGDFFVELFIFLVVGLPYLVILGAAVTGAILLLKLRRKKKQAKKDENPE